MASVQVVGRIKSRGGFVDLLLVDKDTEAYYLSQGTVIRGDMPQVHVQETPERSSRGEWGDLPEFWSF